MPAEPEFGASRHVSTAILAANAVDADVRGALNLATVDELLETARDRGLDVVEFNPEYDHRGEHLQTLFESHGSVPSIAFHRGAFAIEPITYVFGETGLDAVELAQSLVRARRVE